MVSDELKNIIDKLKPQGKMDFKDPATEEQIDGFEKKYNMTFPKQYREWLQYSDGGDLFLPAGVQFYGVEHKPLIDINDDSKPDEKYVVIGALANGDPILCEKDAETISIYNQEAGRIEEDESYKDFYAFLEDLYDLLGIGG